MTNGARLRPLWESGELRRLALSLPAAEFWQAIGMTRQQLRNGRDELARYGVIVPGYLELRGEGSDDAPADVVPQGHVLKGVSTLVGPDGEIKQQWIKTTAGEDTQAQILAAWQDAIAPSRGLFEPVPRPVVTASDLLAVYLLGDCHVGMYAWEAEAGANFDLDIAEHNLVTAADHLTAVSPTADEALVINVGDYFHADSRGNTTTKGTPVDVDGRWSKVIAAGIRTMRRIIERALAKHGRVRVINEIGNHDTHAAVLLSIALAQFYERDVRVSIDTSPQHFHWYRFGRNLIGTHHGHLVKTNDLLGVMATDRAQDWGDTDHRYWYCGHYHHQMVKELPGCVVEYLGSPAPSDAWHHSMGFRSRHDLKLDVLHRFGGRINRHVIGIDQIRKAA